VLFIYYFLWLCSPARAMASCGTAAQRGLWPPVALQPSAGYGLLWLCSPTRAMASCGTAAQRGLWPLVALQPSAGYGLPVHEVSWSHTTTRHSRVDSSGRVIISSQRPVPDNTQYTQQTNIHASGGIRTHDRSRRAAVDLRIRPRGSWNRHILYSKWMKYEYGALMEW
jgi:hypothetical protein